MKRFTRIILIFFLTHSCIDLNAQDENLPSFNLPGQRGNLPVNMVTGAPSLSIPLWTVSDGTLSAPVNAYYSSSGIRPSDIPSELGLQWYLTAGGTITQVVRSGNNILFNLVPNSPHIVDHEASIVNPDDGFLKLAGTGKIDIEPDIFKVNAPGLSCDFMLEGDTGFILLDKSNIKIEYIDINDNASVGFKITSDNGTKYFFEIVKYSKYYQYEGLLPDLTDTRFNKSFVWLLTKMEDANNVDQIVFNYTDNDTTFNEEFLFCYGKYSQKQDSSNSINVLRFEEKTRLYSIETSTEKIVFNYDTLNAYESPYTEYQKDGYTYDRTERFIKGIDVTDKNDLLIKSYEFNYHISTLNRVFLTEIIEKNNYGNALPSYKFTYYNPDMTSAVFSQDIDFWGYQNTPSYQLPFLLSLFPKGEHYGMLNEVFYPEGGYTKYLYEPNQYRFEPDLTPFNADQWEDILTDYAFEDFRFLRAGGYRISKIEDFDGKIRTSKTFEYINKSIIDTSMVSSGQLTSYPLHKISYSAKFYVDSIEPGNAFWQDIGYVSANNIGIEEGTVIYDKITVYEGAVSENISGERFGNNGKTEYFFNFQLPEFDFLHDEGFPYAITVFNYDASSALKKRIVFDKDNKILTEQLNNLYLWSDENIKRTGLRLIDKEYLLTENNSIYTPEPIGVYYKSWYEVRQKLFRMTSTKMKTFNKNNPNQYIENLKTFSYTRNNTDYLYPVSLTETESNGDVLETRLYYPSDFSGEPVYTEKLSRNIYSPVIQKEVYKNGVQISGERTNYKLFNNSENQNLIVIDNKQIWEDGQYKTAETYTDFSEKGSVLCSIGIDSIPHSLILNPDETEIIAVAVNAESDEIFHTSFEYGQEPGNFVTDAKTGTRAHSGLYMFTLPEKEGNYQLSLWKSVNNEWQYFDTVIYNPGNGSVFTLNKGIIDELRVHPVDALMSTSTYIPFIGKSSETDANGNSVYYEYDEFGQLSKLYNQEKILLKEYIYHFSPFAYEAPDGHFGISSDFTVSFYSACQNVQLTATPDNLLTDNSENLTWQWFDDFCGGNLIKESSDLSIGLTPTSKINTYYVRPVVNGYCFPCNSHHFNVLAGVLQFPEDTEFEHTVNESRRTIHIEYSYDACDLELPIIIENQTYKDYDWFHMTLDGQNQELIISFDYLEELSETCQICIFWQEYYFYFTRNAFE